MAQVTCTISEEEVENDDGLWLDGVVATCTKCQNTTSSAGTSSSSIARCLAIMREECPRREANFYVEATTN